MESWDIEKMMEEPPTDYYYDRLSEDLRSRHPQAASHLIDHLVSLEAFLDKSILFGFSFEINKAEVAVAEGKLLGHKIGRSGSSPDEERCQAVVDFPPLREKLHIQQFLGCANWLRGYLPAEYGHAAKVLGQWQKPGAEFPEGGLGAGATAGCKAFKAIKQMMQRHICLASFDEAAAADGSCPLEQIADASGIAVGGSVLQMTRVVPGQGVDDTQQVIDACSAELAPPHSGSVRAARSEARDASDLRVHSHRLLDGSRESDPCPNERYRVGPEAREVGRGDPPRRVRNQISHRSLGDAGRQLQPEPER